MPKKIIYEDEITWLENSDAAFVSLVDRGAIQDGFRILKNYKGEDQDMSKTIYKVLAPVDCEQEKLETIKEEYQLNLEEKNSEELEGFDTYKQAEDEAVNLEEKELVSLDKAANIYAIVAPQVQEDATKTLKAELDYETMDTLVESVFATMDVIMGTLRVPEATKASRRNTIVSALENLKKHVEATLKHVKEDDIIDLENIEVKGENLEPLFYQVTTEKDADLEKQERQEEVANEVEKRMKEAHDVLEQTLDTFKEKVAGMVEEKAEEKFSAMKTSLNDELVEKLEALTEKEEFEAKVKELADGIEELKNTTKQRKSEVDEEVVKSNRNQPKRLNKNFNTLA
jgi:hypothetical protein